jgi:NAD+-dependent protein deacetylase SIR2
LDLRSDDVANDPQLKRVLDVLHKKRKIVVIAGAGISVSAGIPDFRSSGGLFSSLRKQHKLKSSGKDLFDASVYQDDSSTSSFHDMVRSLSQKTKAAQPTPFHHLIATLAQEGRLLRLYSQNVDGIDTSLEPLKTQVPLPKRGPWPKTVQLHGGLDYMVCSKCHTLSEFDAEKFNGPVPPACERCLDIDQVRQVAEKRSHGIGRLRPRMVLYNEHNPDDEAIGSCASLDLRTRPDAVIVAGTTLKVPGVRRIAREMCAVVRDRRDGVTIWINNDPEPVGKDLANSWDIVVKGPCDEIARHAALPQWNDPVLYKEVTDDELLKAKEKQTPAVVVPMSTPKKLQALAQMPTPAQSPRIKPQPATKQASSTPSKAKSKKRKSDVLSTASEKAAKQPTKRQPKKKPAPKSKPKNDNQAITNSFKASKASTISRASNVTNKDFTFIQVDVKSENTSLSKASLDDHDTIKVIPPPPATPKSNGARVTKFKPLKTVAPNDSRNNSSPVMEPFTSPPCSPERPSLHQSEIKVEPERPDDSRPSSSSSRKSDTIVPNSSPRNFQALFDWA